MFDRDVAIESLKAITALTNDIEERIRNWPAPRDADQKELEDLQRSNIRVFPLLRRVAGSRSWNDTLEAEVKAFLAEESQPEGLLEKKFACLFSAGVLSDTWQYAYHALRVHLAELREVSFLFSDLHAFDSLGPNAYEWYQVVVAPVVLSHRLRLTITRVDQTDSIRAHCGTSAEHLSHMLDFAQALRARVLECRPKLGLPDAAGIAVGVALGGCKFNRLTGEPLPDSSTSGASAWYEAAKLMGKAEKLCKHLTDKGGVILVSDAVSQLLGSGFARRKMSSIHASLKDEDYEINVLD
jgi:hypothetical protein